MLEFTPHLVHHLGEIRRMLLRWRMFRSRGDLTGRFPFLTELPHHTLVRFVLQLRLLRVGLHRFVLLACIETELLKNVVSYLLFGSPSFLEPLLFSSSGWIPPSRTPPV